VQRSVSSSARTRPCVLSRGDSKNLSHLLKPEQLGEIVKPAAQNQSGPRVDARELALPGLRLGRPLASQMATPPPSQPPLIPEPSSPLSFFAPTLEGLVDQIIQGLAEDPQKILQLNPSRREAVCRHLEQLLGAPLAPSGAPSDRLKHWLASEEAAQPSSALTQYFRELALIALGQAIVLKAWSDRGIRRWRREDLVDLNACFHGILKSHLPLDREGWQFTRPNLYSWYRLTPQAQETLWKEFSHWKIMEEGPEFLSALLLRLQSSSGSMGSPQRYDEQVLRGLWKYFNSETASDSETPRRRWAFCPTIRDGAVVRSGSTQMGWYGFEQSSFSLFVAELSILWWGPAAPPFWTVGSGMEALTRDQLQLNLGQTLPGIPGKASLHQRISEMEACDVAWVSEEQILRGNSRSLASALFREAVEQNPALKRLRTGGTSLGHLQACVAIAKLRPGGKMWWLRDEPLHASDGSEALQYLLDRGQLLAEWDLTGVQIQLQTAGSSRVLPKSLSLWSREPEIQKRRDHHPLRVRVRGQLRSHVELEPLLEDLLKCLEQTESLTLRRPHWQVFVQQSPQCQGLWADRWPEPVNEESLEKLERIRQLSTPLATLGTIRPWEASAGLKAQLLAGGAQSLNRGFLIRQETIGSGGSGSSGEKMIRRLSCEPLHWNSLPEAGSGFIVILGDEAMSAPVRAFLQSELASFWLDHKLEIRNHRWVLKEQDLKLIPIPKKLSLERDQRIETAFASPLPGKWEQLAASMASQPQLMLQALGESPKEIQAEIYSRAARVFDDISSSQKRLSDTVTSSGEIIWKSLIQKCESSEVTPITLHPEIRIQSPSGAIPLQTPFIRCARSSRGQWSLTLSTESGAMVQLLFSGRTLFEMIADQIESMDHPTWSEIVDFVRAPRKLEVLEHRASSLLRIFGEQSQLMGEIQKILDSTLDSLI
jgi:hypothetical protein